MKFNEQDFKDALMQVMDAHRSEKMKQRILGSFDLQLEGCDEDARSWAEFSYIKQEQYLNPYDGVHGGVACTLADSCMGSTLCAATQLLPSTTDISISYLNPMTADEYMIHVDIKKVGRQLAACTCEISEKNTGKLCVTAMGKFILIRKDILADQSASMLLKEQHE